MVLVAQLQLRLLEVILKPSGQQQLHNSKALPCLVRCCATRLTLPAMQVASRQLWELT